MILKLGLGHTFLVYSGLSLSIIVATGVDKSSSEQDSDLKRKPVNTFFVSKPGDSDIVYWDRIFLYRSYWDTLIDISCITPEIPRFSTVFECSLLERASINKTSGIVVNERLRKLYS